MYIDQLVGSLVVVLLVHWTQAEYSCEKVNQNLLRPCECERGGEYGLRISCKNATQWPTVRKSLNTLTIKRVEHLKIEDLREERFAGDLFKGYHIQSLRLVNCSLKEFGPDALLSLNGTIKSLSLSCGLSRVPSELFSSLYNLTALDLSGNSLQKIAAKSFVGLKNLTELVLDNNQIEKIETDAFSTLDNLEKLSLAKNQLSKIEKNALRNLKKLIYFDLSYNQFKELDKKDLSDFSNLLHL